MIKYLIVFFGAGIGGSFRYWLSSLVQKQFPPYFPYGTLAVNLIGSFILGLMIFGLDERELISPSLKMFIGIGFCGGFTTFSTFSLETFNLLKDAEFLLAGFNILSAVILTILGIYFAYLITR
ncbi:MAG: fluoride efflux transporter CrcB [Ignavibacteriae bacterium HGW-Ignavibacteriae-3]|nr:MAG: fluoride efflux transporter CrcB [Ignavibacteriae bacterium HGW-Ignavibacteriae-3]